MPSSRSSPTASHRLILAGASHTSRALAARPPAAGSASVIAFQQGLDLRLELLGHLALELLLGPLELLPRKSLAQEADQADDRDGQVIDGVEAERIRERDRA